MLQNAVIARNIMRELEAFLPLGALLSIGGTGSMLWERLALALWGFIEWRSGPPPPPKVILPGR